MVYKNPRVENINNALKKNTIVKGSHVTLKYQLHKLMPSQGMEQLLVFFYCSFIALISLTSNVSLL